MKTPALESFAPGKVSKGRACWPEAEWCGIKEKHPIYRSWGTRAGLEAKAFSGGPVREER